MGMITIAQESGVHSTVLSNLFIDEYMIDANDTQLKVYLYLLRMAQAGMGVEVSEIADLFNDTEREILRSLKYWERKRLIALDHDSAKNLVGIRILPLQMQEANFVSAPMTTVSPIKKQIPIASAGNETLTSISSAISAVTEVHTDIAEAKAETKPVKPQYTKDQLKTFCSQENIQQLLFIAESYMQRPLTTGEMNTIFFLSDTCKMSDELIDFLMEYCIERGKKDFRYMEKVGINWTESGITTPQQAQEFSGRYDKSVYLIMNALGKSGTPTAKEVQYIHRWQKEYDFDYLVIKEACDRTVMATDKNRFQYAESILQSWKALGVHHLSDIEHADSMKVRKSSSSKTGTGGTVNRFNQFTQNNYDFAVLEQQLMSN